MENKEFIQIFKNNLKKDARTVSIATLLSARYLRRIKYDPYYQRNYVWEKDKQSFFIESIILGTEIPPMVFYKSGTTVEVIDGRQRFETIKRFRENDFALHSSGLMELKALEGKRYKDLKPEFQSIIDDTTIRIFEFEIIGISSLNPTLEDKIKKEIFRRYNSGITPLNQSEVDNAKYDDDELTGYFKKRLKEDEAIYNVIKECFFPTSTKQKNDLIIIMVTQLRKLLVLIDMPIVRYADSGKTMLLELFYDKFIENLVESGEDSIENVEEQLLDDILQANVLLGNSNPNAYECLVWGIRVMRKEGCVINTLIDASSISSHYKEKNNIYQTESDHYYANIVARFEDTIKFLGTKYNFRFEKYLRDANFRKVIDSWKQTEEDAELTMDKLSTMRIHKPNPDSKPIDQILLEVESNKYEIRPSYQRQEKISVIKASSIIESILLGIKLPPLFLYKREDGVKEVIDGQQRLLTIIGFLGRKYKNEEGQLVTSVNDNFRLKGMRVLTDYNGKKFTEIADKVEDTILDFDIDEIEIEQSANPNFEPTDLFIRLNNKPYPIKPNTFEMWNSIADKDVINKVKEITSENSDWFYITAPKRDEAGRSLDRMQNEELITVLSYLCYNNLKNNDINKVLGFYPRLKKFTCRLKTKSSLTSLLENLELKPVEKDVFLKALDKTKLIIEMIKNVLLDENATKESLNDILNLKRLKRFSRSFQEFYVLWLLLMNVSLDSAIRNKESLLQSINHMFRLLLNVDETDVDDKYVENFLEELTKIQQTYKEL